MSSKPRRQRSWFGRIVRVVVVLVCIGAIGAGYAYWRLKSEPDYWKKNRAYIESRSASDHLETANTVEGKVSQAISRIITGHIEANDPQLTRHAFSASAGRPGSTAAQNGPQDAAPAHPTVETIFLSTDEINSWMAVKFQDWAAQQNARIPPYVTDFMLATEGGNAVLAFHVDKEPLAGVISLVMSVEVSGTGEATLQVLHVRGGTMNVPAADRLTQMFGESGDAKLAEDFRQALDGLTFDPVQTIGDAKVRVLDLAVQEGGVSVTIQAQPKRAAKDSGAATKPQVVQSPRIETTAAVAPQPTDPAATKPAKLSKFDKATQAAAPTDE